MKIQHKVDKICDMISHHGPVEQLWTAQIAWLFQKSEKTNLIISLLAHTRHHKLPFPTILFQLAYGFWI